MTPDEIQIEHDKLALESRRVRLEEQREQRERWTRWLTAFATPVAVFVPLLVAALTFSNNTSAQKAADERQFALEAAQIVMTAKTPLGTQRRAEALAALFPQRLPVNFGRSFVACRFTADGCRRHSRGGDDDPYPTLPAPDPQP